MIRRYKTEPQAKMTLSSLLGQTCPTLAASSTVCLAISTVAPLAAAMFRLAGISCRALIRIFFTGWRPRGRWIRRGRRRGRGLSVPTLSTLAAFSAVCLAISTVAPLAAAMSRLAGISCRAIIRKCFTVWVGSDGRCSHHGRSWCLARQWSGYLAGNNGWRGRWRGGRKPCKSTIRIPFFKKPRILHYRIDKPRTEIVRCRHGRFKVHPSIQTGLSTIVGDIRPFVVDQSDIFAWSDAFLRPGRASWKTK